MSTYPFEFDIAADRGFRARRSGASSRDSGFDTSLLGPRVTAIRSGKEIASKPTDPVRTATPSARVGTVLRRKAEKPAETVAPAAIEAVDTAALERAAAEAAEAKRQADEARIRAQAEFAQAEEARKAAEAEVQLRTERAELIARVRIVDAEVFSLIWVGQSFAREQIIAWVETIGLAEIRTVRWHLDDQTKKLADAKAEEARKAAEAAAEQRRLAEVARKAAEERERLAKPAGPGAATALANAFGQLQERNGTPKNGGKKGFNIMDHLRASAGKPIVSAAPPPTAAKLAEIERRVNGYKEAESESSSTPSGGSRGYLGPRVVQPPTLRERIQRLDPKVVARLHRDCRTIKYRWATIERLLEAESKGLTGLELFVARCEQG